MLRVENQEDLIKQIYQFAKDRNEKGLEKLVASETSLNMVDGEQQAVLELVKEKDVKAALFLVNKYKLSKRWLVEGLARGGDVKEAEAQIAAAPEDQHFTLRKALVRGLAYSGQVEKAKAQIAAASRYKQPHLLDEFMWGLAYGGHIEEAEDQIVKVPEVQRFSLRRELVRGLGFGGRFKEAQDQIAAAPENLHFRMIEGFVFGLGHGGHFKEARAQIADVPEHQRFEPLAEYMSGLGLGGHVQEAEDQFELENQNPLCFTLYKKFVYGLGCGGYLQEAQKQAEEIDSLCKKIAKGLEDGGYLTGHPEGTLHLMLSVEQAELRKYIARQAKEKNTSLNEEKLIEEATRIIKLKNKYSLKSFEKARFLSAQWKIGDDTRKFIKEAVSSGAIEAVRFFNKHAIDKADKEEKRSDKKRRFK